MSGDRALAADELAPNGPRTMLDLLRGGTEALHALRGVVDEDEIRRTGRRVAELELLAPVPRPGKIVAIGRNYRDHAAEQDVEPPPAPLVFAKFPSA
ncbi:MAG TPA: hypothetical protein VGC90_03570, partial [Candidatus Limnocylindrales bacterium]